MSRKRFRAVYDPRGTVLVADVNDLQTKFPVGTTDRAGDIIVSLYSER
jgi:hypothetical protein